MDLHNCASLNLQRICFGLTRSALKPTIYNTLGKNDNYYTPIANHTQGEHANNITTEAILFSI
jgi:hypothetical protein